MKAVFFLCMTLLSFITACQPPSRAQKQDLLLPDRYWKLTELDQKPVYTEGKMKESYIIFDSKEKKAIGSGSCNGFSATYELKESLGIAISKVASTKMACDSIDFEQRFFDMIETADGYQIKGDELILSKAKILVLARFKSTDKKTP
jgi:heat shock protein HslJ